MQTDCTEIPHMDDTTTVTHRWDDGTITITIDGRTIVVARSRKGVALTLPADAVIEVTPENLDRPPAVGDTAAIPL